LAVSDNAVDTKIIQKMVIDEGFVDEDFPDSEDEVARPRRKTRTLDDEDE
jgi:hypothetical protein